MKMKKFLYDLHIHTKEASGCGETYAADIVERYKGLGYDGIVITDHMSAGNFRHLGSNYSEQLENFLKGYYAAKAFEDENFTVILGMELRFLENDNDYLVYGIDEDFLRSRDLTQFETPEDFLPVAKENNLAIFQAHPFRDGMTVLNPTILDGVEVYNLHPSHNSRVAVAAKEAELMQGIIVGGTDYHYAGDAGLCLTRFTALPSDSYELAALLKNKDYIFQIGGGIVFPYANRK